ncbi:MAG: RagB/SusD family nutrient uptake outer membrane protein [Bacteroidales bacterium]|nr:RagB/SusD family nutrient uptake outer membrane protein [Bacteroidales bacterium]
MKIFKYLKSAVLVAIIGLSWSCNNDFLETAPTDALPSDDVFNSIVTAQSALTGAYDQLSTYYFEGMWTTLMSDVMGEDVMINSVDNWNWFVSVYQLNVLPTYTYVENPWGVAYKVIFEANKIIENASLIPDATEEEKEKLEGEAKVIRAYSMLKLIQMYAPAYSADKEVLGILNANKVINYDDEDFPRATVEEIYLQIESDLLSAIDLLPQYTNKGFFDKRAAQAVLARTYLDMEEWEKARDMATEAHKDMELMTINEMYSGFNYRNRETIFTIAYTADDNPIYMSLPSFYWPEAGYSSVRANDEFVKMFTTSDYRSAFFLKEEQIDPDRYLILKFAHNGSVGNAERISIRASEMHLIEAECEAELGNYTDAREALYTVQSARIANVGKSTKSGQELIDEILIERRKELFGEGLRWNDIKRRQQHFKREGDHWARFDFGPEDEDYYRFTLPIPQSEIDTNSKITDNEQNKGY